MEDPVETLVGAISDSVGTTEVAMQLIIGAFGLLFLGYAFHWEGRRYSTYSAVFGWPLIGVFFYLYSDHYVEIDDPVLVLMTAGALPAGLAMSYWESLNDQSGRDSLVWLRGCVVWSMIPYFGIFGVPHLNMAFVQITASSANMMLEFAGLGGYEIGEMMIQRHESEAIRVSEWEGNRWILSETLGEGGFYVSMSTSDGYPVVAFILACSALQSMAVFIGAIVALRTVHWKRRVRALIIALPTIHILNVFRNSGIVWLTHTYPDWSFMGIGMFEFTHSYAAKFASLFAMFLMAVALFDLLPELHKHITRITGPIASVLGNKKAESQHS
tara:strand:- start:6360 stop:7343 length:984 start_codon:yes stop_codon:yes gene_type:complete